MNSRKESETIIFVTYKRNMKPAVKLFSLAFTLLYIIGCSNKENKLTESKKNNIENSGIISPGKNDNPYVDVDISPMDMSYFPIDYPKLKMGNVIKTSPLARVIYSRPHLTGRKLFQNLLKYDEPWRLGANESTELDLYTDAIVQDKKIKEGRYVLYCLPQPDNWTIIINSNIDSWGLHPDSAKDVARFVIPVKQTGNHLEYYTMMFEKTADGADLLMAWDNLEARLPFKF